MLRRSASATMAMVNGHMNETLLGASTIRIYKIQNQMTDKCMKTIDDHQTFYYMEMVSDCWLFLRLQFLTSVFIGALSLSTVLYRDTMGPNLAGLALTSAITVMQDVFLFARYAAALEKAMVSVERIKEYEDIIQVYIFKNLKITDKIRTFYRKMSKLVETVMSLIQWNTIINYIVIMVGYNLMM